jgi:hypothetical protein
MPLSQTDLASAVKYLFSSIDNYSRLVIQKPLRRYQFEPAHAILDSILHDKGLTFAVMMSRQAGKNELSAQLEAYLLNLFQRKGGQIVKASPTFKPQTINSIMRLCDRLDNRLTGGRYRKREGYIVQLSRARALFFSADPAASVVGATASILLEADEAQDISEPKWQKDFLPMGASTNVTRVLWGTAWTTSTLLASRVHDLRRLQRQDGIQRVFTYDADAVAAELPAYGDYVEAEVDRLGRNHPLIKSQYYLEEIDAEAGMFPKRLRALMRGTHPRQHSPRFSAGHAEPVEARPASAPGVKYALLIDVGGETEQPGDPLDRALHQNPRRDATALTVVRVLLPPSGRRAPAGWAGDARRAGGESSLPTYHTVDRHLWLGAKHTALHSHILALARHWAATWILIDATGIGAGLASFLQQALPDRVIPITFSPKLKSDLGWKFLAVVETGRYADYADDGEPDTRQFWYEVEACQYQVRDGPGHQMSWGVTETPAYDGVIARGHDDLLISASLCAFLDNHAATTRTGPSTVLRQTDPLAEIDNTGWN